MKEKSKLYRLPPCLDCDIEGMQNWLQDMANSGLHLSSDGFFLGFGCFHKGEPGQVHYRLDPAANKGGIMSDDMGEPDPDAVALGSDLGWEYVTRRGDFHIWRCSNPDAAELNTDPAVQAMSLKKVKSRAANSLFSALIWAVIWPAAYIFSRNPLTLIIDAGSIKVLLLSVFLLWGFSSSVIRYIALRNLKRRLEFGETLIGRKNWRDGRVRYLAFEISGLIATLAAGVIAFSFLGDSVNHSGRTPLPDLSEPPPFATAESIWPDGEYRMVEFMDVSNYARHWSDPLAPNNWRWREIAEIKLADGSISLALDIDYHEAAFPALAKIIDAEYLRIAEKSDHYTPLPDLSIPGSSVSAFEEGYGYTSAIIRHGNRVIRISVHPWDSDNRPDPEEVIRKVAHSVLMP